MSTRRTSPTRGRAVVATLGIVGGGQLAKMTAQAATQLGCEVVVLEPAPDSPAQVLDTRWIDGELTDPAKLLELARESDVVTLENEFVPAPALGPIERAGHVLRPSARTIGLAQDKLVQKRTLAGAGIPLPRFRPVESLAELRSAGDELGWPVVLKRRRLGYDGKGNRTVGGASEAEAAWERLGGGPDELYVEEFCPFVLELAVIVVQAADGASVAYPVVETENLEHVCRIVRAPARVEPALAERAERIARAAVGAVHGLGAFGVEMFLLPGGALLLNEIAPRVHNTGHYTIEACACSQFENHVRAVLDLPLGSPSMRAPAACMVNLLGAGPGSGRPLGLEDALRVPGASVHVYGKSASQRGRKMGHVTALGATLEAAEATARAAADAIRFGEAPAEARRGATA